jgi:hypothetical protein
MAIEMTYNRVLIHELGFASDNPYDPGFTPSAVRLLAAQQAAVIRKKLDKELRRGVVLAVGPECEEIEVGDVVVYNKKFITPVDLKDGVIKVMLRESFIEAKFEKTSER